MVLAGQSNHAGSNCNLDMAVGCAMVVEILKKWKHE